jgi:prevent-host-death family protein
MRFIAMSELRISPGRVWKRLAKEKELVVTSNGKPVALLCDVDEDRLEETLSVLRQARAQAAVERIRRTAVEKGLDKSTPKMVERETARYRAYRSRGVRSR